MKSNIRNILLLMAFGTLSACSEQTVTVSYQEYPNAFRNPMKGPASTGLGKNIPTLTVH